MSDPGLDLSGLTIKAEEGQQQSSARVISPIAVFRDGAAALHSSNIVWQTCLPRPIIAQVPAGPWIRPLPAIQGVIQTDPDPGC